MSRQRPPFNPAKFADMLDRSYYATGPKGDKEKSERETIPPFGSEKRERGTRPASISPTSSTDANRSIAASRRHARNVPRRANGRMAGVVGGS